jgi:AraC-like DNA-binding protein
MTGPSQEKSHREKLRERARERRIDLVRRREALFDMAASGYSTDTIATQFGLTPNAVRRALAKVVAAQRLDAPDHFVQLQVARLHKALRAAEAAVDRNEMRGVAAMVKVVAQLDRYHHAPLVALQSPRALAAPSGEPLALTHAPARSVET